MCGDGLLERVWSCLLLMPYIEQSSNWLVLNPFLQILQIVLKCLRFLRLDFLDPARFILFLDVVVLLGFLCCFRCSRCAEVCCLLSGHGRRSE